MWLPHKVIDEVDDVAEVFYVDSVQTRLWNEHRREGELRLMTGWCWSALRGRDFRQGFKTQSVAYRDAWYSLVEAKAVPQLERPKLRVVKRRAA